MSSSGRRPATPSHTPRRAWPKEAKKRQDLRLKESPPRLRILHQRGPPPHGREALALALAEEERPALGPRVPSTGWDELRCRKPGREEGRERGRMEECDRMRRGGRSFWLLCQTIGFPMFGCRGERWQDRAARKWSGTRRLRGLGNSPGLVSRLEVF